MNNLKIAYITSSSYSGSTLLSLILNAHPSIATISEFDARRNMARDPQFKCSCGRLIETCPFFAQLRDIMHAEGFSFEIRDMNMLLDLSTNTQLNALLTGKIPLLNSCTVETVRDTLVDFIPKYRRTKEVIYARNEVLFKAILSLQDGSIFLDANKNPHRMLFLSKRFDVKGLYLFKNGIAGVYSFLKLARRENEELSVENATRRWFLEQITISRCLLKLGRDRSMQIAYTDLCQSTSTVLQKTCEFLAIEPVSLDGFAKVPHHVIGNVMRLGDFSQIQERTDWKENMSADDIDRYRRVAAKFLPHLEAINPTLTDKIWI